MAEDTNRLDVEVQEIVTDGDPGAANEAAGADARRCLGPAFVVVGGRAEGFRGRQEES